MGWTTSDAQLQLKTCVPVSPHPLSSEMSFIKAADPSWDCSNYGEKTLSLNFYTEISVIGGANL